MITIQTVMVKTTATMFSSRAIRPIRFASATFPRPAESRAYEKTKPVCVHEMARTSCKGEHLLPTVKLLAELAVLETVSIYKVPLD